MKRDLIGGWANYVVKDDHLGDQQYRVRNEPKDVYWTYFGHDPEDARYMVVYSTDGVRSVLWWDLIPVDGDQEDLTGRMHVEVGRTVNPKELEV
jgi:hypothetical protein